MIFQADAERAREENTALQEKLEKSQGEVYRLKAKLENAQGEQDSLRQELDKSQSGVSRIHADRDKVSKRFFPETILALNILLIVGNICYEKYYTATLIFLNCISCTGILFLNFILSL